MNRTTMYILTLTLTLAACSDEAAQNPPAGDGAVTDPGKALYDPTRIVRVEITMPAADWEVVRKDQRDLSAFYGPNCRQGPVYSTYVWKQTTRVKVDGKTFNSVGIRKKGFIGSVNDTKPGLKLKFDKFVPGQTAFGMERMTLNNNTSDPSFMHQCLAYDHARKAGLAAPRCNYATVSVNGQHLGLYSNIEPLKKRFLARHFADNDGHLYEGLMSDFRYDWRLTFEDKTSSTDKNQAGIKAIAAVLKLSDDKLLAALAPLVDLDNFYTYWAFEVLFRHPDGYANKGNNFFVDIEPGATGKLHFIPWGMDKTWLPSSLFNQDVYAKTILPMRLYRMKSTQAKYLAAMNKLLTDVWDETRLKAEIDRIEALIKDEAARDPWLKAGGGSKGGGKGGGDFASSVQALRDFVIARRAEIKKVVDNPPVSTETLGTITCSTPGKTASYTATGTFKTTYGTSGGADPFASGSGTFALTSIKDGAVTIQKVGSGSGTNTKAGGHSAVEVVGQVKDSKGTFNYVARFVIPDASFVAGKTVKLAKGSSELSGNLVVTDSAKTFTYPLGTLSGGTLTLTKAGTTKGAAVEGSFTAEWGGTGSKGGK